MKNLIFLTVFFGTYVFFACNTSANDSTSTSTVQAGWLGGAISTTLDSTIQPQDSAKVQSRKYTVFKSSRILSTKELREAKRKRALEQDGKKDKASYFGIK
ncbi:MAG: hypothetical protein GY810_25025 [Aureispira sp.]|nr:hypothetical protein [Aureispira sp.]